MKLDKLQYQLDVIETGLLQSCVLHCKSKGLKHWNHPILLYYCIVCVYKSCSKNQYVEISRVLQISFNNIYVFLFHNLQEIHETINDHE
jgi:hypothetical protein